MLQVKLEQSAVKNIHSGRISVAIWKHRYFYVILIPSIVAVFIFQYMPMFGILIAFQDFNIMKGFLKSDFVGLKHFQIFLSDPVFFRVFFYTIKVSLIGFVFSFPAPIMLALLLNELRNQSIKRVVQSISYLPHFLSWVIGAVIVYSTFSSDGIVNVIITQFKGKPVSFLGNPKYFISLVVVSSIWKDVGWGTIIYLASISGISPELYESAFMDGANKWKQVWYITLPSIIPTVVIIGLYAVGGLLSVNFEQVFNLQNDLIRSDTNVIATYVYFKGIQQGNYSLATAFGLFNAVLTFVLLASANRISKKVSSISLW